MRLLVNSKYVFLNSLALFCATGILLFPIDTYPSFATRLACSRFTRNAECVLKNPSVPISFSSFDIVPRHEYVEPLRVAGFVFFFAQLIQIAHNRIVTGLHLAVICGVCNAEPCVQLGNEDFKGVDLLIGEILISSEKVL